MKRIKFFSLLLALVLVANFSYFSTDITINYGVSTCDENPLDPAFNDH